MNKIRTNIPNKIENANPIRLEIILLIQIRKLNTNMNKIIKLFRTRIIDF